MPVYSQLLYGLVLCLIYIHWDKKASILTTMFRYSIIRLSHLTLVAALAHHDVRLALSLASLYCVLTRSINLPHTLPTSLHNASFIYPGEHPEVHPVESPEMFTIDAQLDHDIKQNSFLKNDFNEFIDNDVIRSLNDTVEAEIASLEFTTMENINCPSRFGC